MENILLDKYIIINHKPNAKSGDTHCYIKYVAHTQRIAESFGVRNILILGKVIAINVAQKMKRMHLER